MKVVISRSYNSTETTGHGVVFDGDDNLYDFKTIELPQLGNQHNISCIPEGEYKVHKITSPKRGKCFWVLDVPDRDAILIHIGNYASGKKVDTQGCILPGTRFEDANGDGNIDVVESTVAMKKLLTLLPNEFILHII